jgi:hypothetical protein
MHAQYCISWIENMFHDKMPVLMWSVFNSLFVHWGDFSISDKGLRAGHCNT